MTLLVGLDLETPQGTGGGGEVGRFFLEMTELFEEDEYKLDDLDGGFISEDTIALGRLGI